MFNEILPINVILKNTGMLDLKFISFSTLVFLSKNALVSRKILAYKLR
jgi:hypothetical protein